MPLFRKALPQDAPAMARIADEGKALLKSCGISQWQRGTYPDLALFESDIRSGIGYVAEENGTPAAVCAITVGEEDCYRQLDSGAWLTPADTLYGVIHRGAVGEAFRGQGMGAFLLKSAAETAVLLGAHSVRADTHPDNLAMQHTLEKAGFVRCGTLTLTEGDETGDPRLAYEWIPV